MSLQIHENHNDNQSGDSSASGENQANVKASPPSNYESEKYVITMEMH